MMITIHSSFKPPSVLSYLAANICDLFTSTEVTGTVSLKTDQQAMWTDRKSEKHENNNLFQTFFSSRGLLDKNNYIQHF